MVIPTLVIPPFAVSNPVKVLVPVTLKVPPSAVAPATARLPVKFAADDIVWPFMSPLVRAPALVTLNWLTPFACKSNRLPDGVVAVLLASMTA